MNMFERSVVLTQQVVQFSGDRLYKPLKGNSKLIPAFVVGKLRDAQENLSYLMEKVVNDPIEIQEVESYMKKLDEILQMVADLDKENGKELRLNEDKL